MYCPDSFSEKRPEIIQEMIRSHPLATIVSMGNDGLEANHIPLYLTFGQESQIVLQGHVARANPLWREGYLRSDVLVIFQGPQHYISPSWYITKAETGKVVPTWNYTIVHAYGELKVKDNPEWIRQQMVAMTDQQEQNFPHPWHVDDAPPEFTEQVIKQVVGIEIFVTRWMGKWKVSQNQSAGNRDSVNKNLRLQNQPDSAAMSQCILSACRND
ncbi:FMN-binding negative transcriptional regulator [Acidithiobacillus albertensis]|uniref:FMN-binding negative transcriptional regulator n=1 Tax=Acidithiobacillus albertensis TaxID=119978 RepID=UPI00094AA1E8|nr:FMN-binding negative transcriptional regulator [Acidithiobacillus albertensis]